jgi:hypothetical protein
MMGAQWFSQKKATPAWLARFAIGHSRIFPAEPTSERHSRRTAWNQAVLMPSPLGAWRGSRARRGHLTS